MKPLTRTTIEEYTQRLSEIEPIEFVAYMKDNLLKENPNLLGLMEYLRIKLSLGQEQLVAMSSIIRYAMIQQKNNNEISYMVYQEAPKSLIVSDDIIHYIYDQIENRYEQFIPMIMQNISNDDEKEFMNFVLKVTKIEMAYSLKLVTEFIPTFETRIIGYIPMFCTYDLYKEYLEEDFKTIIEK